MTENENIRIADESLDNAISVYKTTIKAVEQSKNSDYCPILDKVTVALLEELKSYRAIGTIEEFKDLKEKSEPKKPYYVQYDGNPKIGNPHCSNCCGIINNGGTAKGMHCKWCGQKLDWSE